MTDQYIDMLKKSLVAKKQILGELIVLTADQKKLLQAEEMDWDAFDALVDEKALLIDKLAGLDEGFSAVYDRIGENIKVNPSVYEDQVKEMQKLIQDVTDASASLMSEEERNKQLVTVKFSAEKKRLAGQRNNARVAGSYKQAMSRINYVDPQLMDKKK